MKKERKSLRERKREKLRADLVDAAMRFFIEKGYNATTVEEIADSVMVSDRTVFRYFETKEEILFSGREQLVAESLAILNAPDPAESPVQTCYRAAVKLGETLESAVSVWAPRYKIIFAVPTLRARNTEMDLRDLQEPMEQLLVGSAADEGESIRARLQAAALNGTLQTAIRIWVEQDGKISLVQLIDLGFSIPR